jgi:phosphatidylglycerophosphatase A
MGKKKKIWDRESKIMSSSLRKIFLTLFYSGLFPKAPGTIGTIVSLAMAMLLLQYFTITNLFMASILISIIAIKQINIYEKEVGAHDGSEIVIDELAGMWIALSVANVQADSYILALIAFVYFRLFDILKPSIIGRIDRDAPGGLGVMGDDIVAGFFAGIATSATAYILSSYFAIIV